MGDGGNSILHAIGKMKIHGEFLSHGDLFDSEHRFLFFQGYE